MLGWKKLSRSSKVRLFFFHLHLFDGVLFLCPQVLLIFLYYKVLILSGFGCSFPSIIWFFHSLLSVMQIFLCQIPFVYRRRIFLLIISDFPLNSTFCKYFCVVLLHKIIDQSCDLVNLYQNCKLPQHVIEWNHCSSK